MRYFKKLVGKKVYLSPINIDDYEIYTKWMNDFKVTDGIGASARIYSLEREKEHLNNKALSKDYTFAIVSLDKDKLLGNCSLMDVDTIKGIATIGIMIGEEENRCKGYGSDALKLLIEYAFDYLNLHNVMLVVYSFNEVAINAYKKVGFKEFGRRHEALLLKGKYYDDIYMEILESDYRKEK